MIQAQFFMFGTELATQTMEFLENSFSNSHLKKNKTPKMEMALLILSNLTVS